MNPAFAGAIVCVIAGAVLDLRTSKIPNWLTLPCAALGLFMNWYAGGTSGILSGLAGCVVGFALLFLFYLLGGMGAGDVKLLAAAGSFVGPRLVFYAFIWMALAGGLLAVISMIGRRACLQTFRNLRLLFLAWVLRAPSDETNLTIKNQSLAKLPYGVAIAAGTVLAVWLQSIPGLGL